MADLVIPDDVTEALKEIRNDKNPNNFAVVGYDASQAKALCLLGQGENGVEGLKELIQQDDVCYALLRVDYTYESVGNIKSNTTRFLLIYYRPENIPLKRKMMLGSVDGKIKKLFAPVMTTLEIASVDEISAEKVSDVVDSITMTKSKVTEKKATDGVLIDGKMIPARTARSDSVSAKRVVDSRSDFTTVKGAEVTFTDEEQFAEMMAKVRNDQDSTRWILFTYADKKTISFTASGEGDVSEMLEQCPTDAASYGLFRVVQSYDKGRNSQGEKTVKIDQVKFGFVTFVPEENLSPVLKAVISTHKGVVVSKFRPFHYQWYLNKKDELDEEKALDCFSAGSGTKSYVTDKKVEKKEVKYERKFVGGASNEVQKLAFENEEELLEAIKEVRNDNSETVWALAGFVGGKRDLKLKFMTSGSNVSGLTAALTDDAVQYALVRTTESIDGYDTTKFNLVKYEGPEVPITMKGSTGVFHGAVTSVFGQAHTYGAFSSKEELDAKFSL